MSPKLFKMDKGLLLVQNWLNTLHGYNSALITSLYSNSGVLLGTLATEPLVGLSEIKSYFDEFVELKPLGVVTWHNTRKLGCRRICVDGNYTFCLNDKEDPDKRKEAQARFTFVFKRFWFGEWAILTHHSSEVPKEKTQI